MPVDENLRQDVTDELLWDPKMDSTGIAVSDDDDDFAVSCHRLQPRGLHKDEMWWDPLGTGVLEHAGRSRPWSSRRSRCGSYVRLMFIAVRSPT
jgi:hypothetical protein